MPQEKGSSFVSGDLSEGLQVAPSHDQKEVRAAEEIQAALYTEDGDTSHLSNRAAVGHSPDPYAQR